MAKHFAIGALAQAAGVKVPTIRYYEIIGLLPSPERSDTNRRVYGEDAIQRLRFIRHARELGFVIEDIQQLLALSDDPKRSCKEVDAIAKRHLADIDSRIERLSALKTEVSRMIKQCAKGTVAQCRIIDVLAHHEHCLHDEH